MYWVIKGWRLVTTWVKLKNLDDLPVILLLCGECAGIRRNGDVFLGLETTKDDKLVTRIDRKMRTCEELLLCV
ncbi:hypothetical protein [Maridesulfovibrio ferrireducens]|nr:hypothetical protein [Maridesulfovibrio ferrireducens]